MTTIQELDIQMRRTGQCFSEYLAWQRASVGERKQRDRKDITCKQSV